MTRTITAALALAALTEWPVRSATTLGSQSASRLDPVLPVDAGCKPRPWVQG